MDFCQISFTKDFSRFDPIILCNSFHMFCVPKSWKIACIVFANHYHLQVKSFASLHWMSEYWLEQILQLAQVLDINCPGNFSFFTFFFLHDKILTRNIGSNTDGHKNSSSKSSRNEKYVDWLICKKCWTWNTRCKEFQIWIQERRAVIKTLWAPLQNSFWIRR